MAHTHINLFGSDDDDTLLFERIDFSPKFPHQDIHLSNTFIYILFYRYDSSTGVFTVPPGGDGVYYFSTHLSIDQQGFGIFSTELNDEVICSAKGDQNTSGAGDSAAASCSAVVDVVAGKNQFVFLVKIFIVCLCNKVFDALLSVLFSSFSSKLDQIIGWHLLVGLVPHCIMEILDSPLLTVKNCKTDIPSFCLMNDQQTRQSRQTPRPIIMIGCCETIEVESKVT